MAKEIDTAIERVLKKYKQPSSTRVQFERLFENLAKKNYDEGDLEAMVDSIELEGEEDVGQ